LIDKGRSHAEKISCQATQLVFAVFILNNLCRVQTNHIWDTKLV